MPLDGIQGFVSFRAQALRLNNWFRPSEPCVRVPKGFWVRGSTRCEHSALSYFKCPEDDTELSKLLAGLAVLEVPGPRDTDGPSKRT